jgi:hypothetical protein
MNKKNNSFLATRKPVLILKQKNDSTYIAADTIFSGFTTFVNNTNQVLKNDSVVNVNVPENEKVHQTISNDSTAQFFEKIHQDEIDSAQKISLKKDSLKIEPEENQLIKPEREHIGPPVKKSLQKKSIQESKIDSIPIKDSLQKEISLKKQQDSLQIKDSLERKDSSEKHKIDSAVLHDSTQKKIEANENNFDSLQTDSTQKIIPHQISDSLKSGIKHDKDSVNKSDSSIRYFLAFHHVKIFNDSLQSICDSLFISSKDSVFRLYYNPVLWSGNTEIAGDTMFLYTENKQPKRLYVFESGLIVNRTKEGFFNQMSGKTINGYFVDGKIDYMRVRGTQSESIYYMQDDDSAYIGMNRATGDVIDLYFKNENLKKVLFVNNIQGTMYPMSQIPEDQKRLKVFKWLEDKRPKNKAQLFE